MKKLVMILAVLCVGLAHGADLYPRWQRFDDDPKSVRYDPANPEKYQCGEIPAVQPCESWTPQDCTAYWTPRVGGKHAQGLCRNMPCTVTRTPLYCIKIDGQEARLAWWEGGQTFRRGRAPRAMKVKQ